MHRIKVFDGMKWIVLICLLSAGELSCGGSSTFDPPEKSPPRGTYDPTAGCQQALSHIIDLSIKATGQGPSDKQRGDFLRRCVETSSDRGSYCVLDLKRLPGRRGGTVNLGPAWSCLRRK